MEIDVDTKLIPVIGKPLRQSVSYKMGNNIYEIEGLNYFRFPIEVEREYLGDVLNGLKYMNVSGIGITKPYKVEVMQYLDEIDELAEKIGAVNSIEVRDGRLIGHNKDGEGFVVFFRREIGREISSTIFFCIGAGGAGKAICWTLAYRGARKIYITDKFEDAGEKLVAGINGDFKSVAEFIPARDLERTRAALAQSQVLMNASGVGMAPNLQDTPLAKELFMPGHIVFDATYNPKLTQFLKDAQASGCQVFNGKGMLIGCSMLGFEERTGRPADYETWSKVFDAVMEGSEIR